MRLFPRRRHHRPRPVEAQSDRLLRVYKQTAAEVEPIMRQAARSKRAA